ncbi:oligosaccharide flippase family protein [Oscillospiraceae bacterium MB08-C2-2]|nr:oligosaccharide flippase family protein [Oscillospiraceae bacterium MB08-C2-2]
MGKYKNLVSNTVVFALGTFSSKLLVFFLMPFYTRMLSAESYGTMDLVVNTCNLILPVVTLCMAESVIRFTLDKAYRKSEVFSAGLAVELAGYAVLILLYPLLHRVELISEYTLLIYLYVLTSFLRSLTSNFVRSLGFVRLFALDGMFTTITTVGFNVLFLAGFGWGVKGYVLATIASDGLSTLGLFLILKLHRFVKLGSIHKKTIREMLRYSLPLIPTALGWWITNLSDRYMVSYMVGLEANGLYSAAYKIPTMITLVSAIFIQAWQISAFSEYEGEENVRFFSNVFRTYCTFIFMAASGLILLIRPITKILLAPEYYSSWQYAPFLILAVSFSCLVTFLGTIYNAAKSNGMALVTTFVGAAVNIVLNVFLIPKYGATGSAFATFASYFIVFLIRAVDTQRFVKVRMAPVKIAMYLALLLLQIWVSMTEPKFGVWIQVAILLLIVVMSLGYIVFFFRWGSDLLKRRKNPQEN